MDCRRSASCTADTRTYRRTLLPVLGRPITRGICLALAHVGALLRAPVPTLALEMVNARAGIQPDHGVTLAMGLCVALGLKEGLSNGRQRPATAARGTRIGIDSSKLASPSCCTFDLCIDGCHNLKPPTRTGMHQSNWMFARTSGRVRGVARTQSSVSIAEFRALSSMGRGIL